MNKELPSLSVAIADKLLRALKQEKRKTYRPTAPGELSHIPCAPIVPLIAGQFAGITLQARFAWRYELLGERRKVFFTGGVSVEARAPQPSKMGKSSVSKSYRLPPGWDKESFHRMIDRAITWAVVQQRTGQYRERVMCAFDAAPEAVRDQAMEYGNVNNWPVTYNDMTIDDCDRWLDWMKCKLEGKKVYANNEILPFDGTLDGLIDTLQLLKATMPKHPAFVLNRGGGTVNRVRVTTKTLTDGSQVWDAEVYGE